MRFFEVRFEPQEFSETARLAGDDRIPTIRPHEWPDVMPGSYVLAGNSPPESGGGRSKTGYVMQHGKCTHSTPITDVEIDLRQFHAP